MKNGIVLTMMLCFVLGMTGCGKDGASGGPGPAGPQGPAAVAAANPNVDVQNVVNDENAYRLGLGQTQLSPGLSCTLYTITGGQYIQNDATHTPTLTGTSQVATFLLTAPFNQPDSSVSAKLNVLPAALQANATYQNLILLRCQGQIVITDTDYYEFDLASDDGSVLYIDNSRLIDNDGNHAIRTVTGTKYLRRGVHVFRLDFAQTGGGNQALVLNANGALLPANVMYH